jgi:hypothetical protein
MYRQPGESVQSVISPSLKPSGSSRKNFKWISLFIVFSIFYEEDGERLAKETTKQPADVQPHINS